MRFKHENIPEPKLGNTKSEVKFLLFPKRLDNETRWLEFAKIEYSSYLSNKGQKWLATSWLPYDPVKDCEMYKTEGCIHVDGMICDIEECNSKLNK